MRQIELIRLGTPTSDGQERVGHPVAQTGRGTRFRLPRVLLALVLGVLILEILLLTPAPALVVAVLSGSA